MQLSNTTFTSKFVTDAMSLFMSPNESEQNEAVAKAHSSLCVHEVTLIDLISSMEMYLTSPDERTRSRATLFLAKVLSTSPSIPLPSYQLHHLLVFFMHRLADHPSTPPSLVALQSLITGYYSVLDAKYGDINDLLQQLFALDCPSQPQSIRYKTFELHISILTLLPSHVAFSTGKSEYVSSVLDSIEGEKDPRCLLLTLRIGSLLAPMIQSNNLNHMRRLFESVICYFPITFSPPPNDPYQITSEMLQEALTNTLTSARDIASLTIPFLLNTLHDANASSSTQAWHILSEIVRLYTYAPFSSHSTQCSELLLENAASGDAPEIMYGFITMLSRSISLNNDGDATSSFIYYFLTYCSRKLQSAATLVSASMKHISLILLSLCRATLPLAYTALSVVLPILLKHLKESLASGAPTSGCGSVKSSSSDNSEITLVVTALVTQLLQTIPANTTFSASTESNPLISHGSVLCTMLTAVLYQRPLGVELEDVPLHHDEEAGSGCCGGGCGLHGQTNQTTSVVKPQHLQSAAAKCLQELLIRYTPSDVDIRSLIDPMPLYLTSSPPPLAGTLTAFCSLLASLMDLPSMADNISIVVDGIISSTNTSSVSVAACLLSALPTSACKDTVIDQLASHVIDAAAIGADISCLISLKDVLENARVATILVERNKLLVFAELMLSHHDKSVVSVVGDVIELAVKNATASTLNTYVNDVVALARSNLSSPKSIMLLHSALKFLAPKSSIIDSFASDVTFATACVQQGCMGGRVVALILNKCSNPVSLLDAMLTVAQNQELICLVYIVKAYCMRPDTRVAAMTPLLEVIVSRLPALPSGTEATHPIATLLEPDNTLSPNSTANTTPLYGSKMWSQLQKLFEPQISGSATTISHPILLAYISLIGASVVPMGDGETCGRHIVMALTMPSGSLEKDLKTNAVIALKKYITECANYLVPHLAAIIPQLLSISQTYPPRARAASLECLFAISQTLPYITLHSMKTQVVKGLIKTLDDPKAAIRLLAAKARNAWISMQ